MGLAPQNIRLANFANDDGGGEVLSSIGDTLQQTAKQRADKALKAGLHVAIANVGAEAQIRNREIFSNPKLSPEEARDSALANNQTLSQKLDPQAQGQFLQQQNAFIFSAYDEASAAALANAESSTALALGQEAIQLTQQFNQAVEERNPQLTGVIYNQIEANNKASVKLGTYTEAQGINKLNEIQKNGRLISYTNDIQDKFKAGESYSDINQWIEDQGLPPDEVNTLRTSAKAMVDEGVANATQKEYNGDKADNIKANEFTSLGIVNNVSANGMLKAAEMAMDAGEITLKQYEFIKQNINEPQSDDAEAELKINSGQVSRADLDMDLNYDTRLRLQRALKANSVKDLPEYRSLFNHVKRFVNISNAYQGERKQQIIRDATDILANNLAERIEAGEVIDDKVKKEILDQTTSYIGVQIVDIDTRKALDLTARDDEARDLAQNIQDLQYEIEGLTRMGFTNISYLQDLEGQVEKWSLQLRELEVSR